jgi:endonuclease YncB( thermonuclease family)
MNKAALAVIIAGTLSACSTPAPDERPSHPLPVQARAASTAQSPTGVEPAAPPQPEQPSPSSTANQVVGTAHVVDGDTFRLGDRTIRMSGIDAPEARQTCDGVPGLRECGVLAAEQLRRRIEGSEVACDVEGRDDYDRLIASCLIGGRDLSE